MPALRALAMVWLGTGSPSERSAAALDAWAEAHGFTLEAPRRESADPGDAAREAIAGRCDAALDRARDQLQAGDDGAAARTLEGIEAALREHPGILQASWLMAERFRLQARLARASSFGDAAQWDRRADVLEGVRASPFGEAPTSRPSPPLAIHTEIAVHGAREYAIYWDGVQAAADVQTDPGEHHLLIFRGPRLAWAGWVSALVPGKIDVWVPEAPACSAYDLRGVALEDGKRIRVPADVRCSSWAAAFPRTGDLAISIAVCNEANCRPVETWAGDAPESLRTSDPSASKNGLPTWVAWTLTGAGVAAATSVVLWQAGVFSKSSEGRVVYDGSHLGAGN